MTAAMTPRPEGCDMNIHILDSMRRLLREQRGLTTVEYVIVLCLIAVVAVGTWQKFGSNVEGYLDTAKTSIETEMAK
jgi:Flp pilus assembly pilin Flp